MSTSLDSLLHHPALWRARTQARAPRRCVPSGHPELDACLPGRGWPLPALIEVLLQGPEGHGEVALFVPALKRLIQTGPSVICWVNPPQTPYAPALQAWNLDPGRQLIVRAQSSLQAHWAMEQALRSRACGAVLGWTSAIRMEGLRKLKLATMESGGFAVVYRPASHCRQPSPATVRLLIDTDRIEVLKVQGGRPGVAPWRP